MNCQCGDPGCPACQGECKQRAVTALVRSDLFGFPDESGFGMCRPCANDACESGVCTESIAEKIRLRI